MWIFATIHYHRMEVRKGGGGGGGGGGGEWVAEPLRINLFFNQK